MIFFISMIAVIEVNYGNKTNADITLGEKTT